MNLDWRVVPIAATLIQGATVLVILSVSEGSRTPIAPPSQASAPKRTRTISSGTRLFQ